MIIAFIQHVHLLKEEEEVGLSYTTLSLEPVKSLSETQSHPT